MHQGRNQQSRTHPVPKPRGHVVAAGQHGAAVGTELHAQDTPIVPQRAAASRTGGRVPEPRGLVETVGQREPPVGAKRNGDDLLSVDHWLSNRLSSGCVPEPRGLVVADGHDRSAVRAEGDGEDQILVREWRGDRSAGRAIPEPDGLVNAASQDGSSVGVERDGVACSPSSRSTSDCAKRAAPDGGNRRHGDRCPILANRLPEDGRSANERQFGSRWDLRAFFCFIF
jgi:hypothetical protein